MGNSKKQKPLHKKDWTLPGRVREALNSHLQEEESWRIFKVLSEFVKGFELLQRYKKAATFFGTSRCSPNHALYKEATKLARKLSKQGFAIITGGGPGIMEAANKGAYEAKGASVGLNIQLPQEQRRNKYVKDGEAFHYFFTRKVMLAFASEVYIFFPGGFGTLDEFFEIVTLVQTKKIKPIPIIMVGRKYWEPLLAFIKETVYKESRAIGKEDMKLYHLADSVGEAMELINKLVK